jgi:hypothetical protein
MPKRINFTASDVQTQRMQELCDLHGYQNVNQCAKYLLQRGLTIECSSAGILTTNDKLAEMIEVMDRSVADTVVPPQSLINENLTAPLNFENMDEKG